MIIFFDIETISSYSLIRNTESEHEEIENINRLEEYQKLEEKYQDKLNFMPEYNKILCISCGYIHNDTGEIITKSISGAEEDVINKFFEFIGGRQISGWNILGFDIPFIIKRALYYKIKIPESLKFYGRKPWDMTHIIDLKDIYKNGVYGAFCSLDLACKFLGITSPKDKGIDGSQVQEFYDNGKEKEIIEYCERDVKATIEVYNYFKEFNLI